MISAASAATAVATLSCPDTQMCRGGVRVTQAAYRHTRAIHACCCMCYGRVHAAVEVTESGVIVARPACVCLRGSNPCRMAGVGVVTSLSKKKPTVVEREYSGEGCKLRELEATVLDYGDSVQIGDNVVFYLGNDAFRFHLCCEPVL